jgi:NADPH:quinone reductase-like Zn-dependent oxidoreductase
MTHAVREMHAMLASSADPASLAYQAIPVPEPGPGELLVQVRATAVTSGELEYPEAYPAIPCHDLSGTVTAAGAAVAGWQAGDAVYALIGFDRPGAAAEYVTVPAADVASRPATVSYGEAAAVPLGGLTAWQALHTHGHVQAGQHVLVHGGAGGVGGYAVQLAAAAGAAVTATASARDADFVAGLGASRVIDYTTRFEDQVSDVDLIIDPVGGEVMARSWAVLRPGGTLVGIAEAPGDSHPGGPDTTGVFFIVEPDGAQLRELAGLIDAGQLRPLVADTLELPALAEAFNGKRPRRAPGKFVISVAPAAT